MRIRVSLDAPSDRLYHHHQPPTHPPLPLPQVVKKRLGFNEPSVGVGASQLWEEGEGAETNDFVVDLPKMLADLPAGGVKDGAMLLLSLEDFSQDMELEVRGGIPISAGRG